MAMKQQTLLVKADRDRYAEFLKPKHPQMVALDLEIENGKIALIEGPFEPEGGARQMVAMLASGSRKAALPSVKAPTLVIHGAEDPLVPLAAGEDTARSIPNAKLVVIERMGHTLPRAVWPRVIDAIAAIAR